MDKIILKITFWLSVFIVNNSIVCSDENGFVEGIERIEWRSRQEIIDHQDLCFLVMRHLRARAIQSELQSQCLKIMLDEHRLRAMNVARELWVRNKIEEAYWYGFEQAEKRDNSNKCRKYIDEIMELQRRGEKLDPV